MRTSIKIFLIIGAMLLICYFAIAPFQEFININAGTAKVWMQDVYTSYSMQINFVLIGFGSGVLITGILALGVHGFYNKMRGKFVSSATKEAGFVPMTAPAYTPPTVVAAPSTATPTPIPITQKPEGT